MTLNQKIVIIGGSGFVGTRLIDLIGSEHCLIIDKVPSQKYNAITTVFDIRDNNLEAHLPDNTKIVILLAAEHRDDVTPYSLYYDVNVTGTKNVLNALDKKGIKNLFFTSSAAVYGLGKPNPDENFPLQPSNHYGKSKMMAEEILQKWVSTDLEKKLTIMRSAVIFGEGNKGNVHNLLKQIASGHFVMIGSGKNKKSMAYVGNAAAFINFCIENSSFGLQIYNYVDTPDLTMNDLVAEVERCIGQKLPPFRLPYWLGVLGGMGFDLLSWLTRRNFAIKLVRVQKFCATTQFNATKAHTSGFTPPYTLAQGLSRTLKSEFPDQNQTS